MVNMENIETMGDWERKKAIFLLKIAEDLGINTGSYGELAVNPSSGYTYLWVEDHNFCLYLPITCELTKSDIYAIWSNPEDGEEIEISLSDDTTLEDLEEWAEKLSKDGE